MRDLMIAAAFGLCALLLFLWRITDPGKLDFDETHYVPSARLLIDFASLPNPEHPPLGKWLIGIGMLLFDDTPLGWRIMSALFGATLVFAGVMTARWLLLSRAAAVMTGILLLFSQTLFIQSRIGMLDIFMASFLMLAFWMLTAAIRKDLQPRSQIVLAGLFLGLAVACKWTAIPLVAAAIIAFAFTWRRIDPAKRPISLIEGLFWLGPFAVLVYLLTFTPLMFLRNGPIPAGSILAQQLEMFRLQAQVLAPHTYQSRWWQWVLDLRPIWYFYEPFDGVQRGILYLGNPAICWGGLLALVISVHAGVEQKAYALLVPPLLYLAALSFSILIPKPVQFYYHYLVPTLLLCFAIAGVLDHLFWARGKRIVPLLCVTLAGLVFLDFYPIISAAPLDDAQAFNRWMWLDSWR
jgi:dolichyl-phosphate-mannose--protein O-mannosyl transferase